MSYTFIENSTNNLSWLRRDTLTASVYYGYSSNPNAQDTDSSWSIKKVSTSGTVDSVSWTNGSPNQQISTWANRYSSFTSPTQSISLTWSTSLTYISSVQSLTSINLKWNTISGIDNYQIIVKDQKGNIYSDAGFIISNNQNFNEIPYTNNQVLTTFYNYKSAITGTTYSITVIGSNVVGSTSSVIFVGV